MKKILYFLMVAVMAITMASCGWNTEPEPTPVVEDEPTYMVWQDVDSTTSVINLNDSSFITMTFDSGNVVFETQGIDTFKITADSTDLYIENDSNTYTVPLFEINGRHAKIQADSTELEIDLDI